MLLHDTAGYRHSHTIAESLAGSCAVAAMSSSILLNALCSFCFGRATFLCTSTLVEVLSFLATILESKVPWTNRRLVHPSILLKVERELENDSFESLLHHYNNPLERNGIALSRLPSLAPSCLAKLLLCPGWLLGKIWLCQICTPRTTHSKP